ncbi:hypothetical protein [Ahrensia kielensis]|uniref:hypothetical protein n=1 Tax=Ahrensia kielensis TaxID=76980 RepID=UPI0012E9E984|nr:hypothetical protein [Ahrensia kielensis]
MGQTVFAVVFGVGVARTLDLLWYVRGVACVGLLDADLMVGAFLEAVLEAVSVGEVVVVVPHLTCGVAIASVRSGFVFCMSGVVIWLFLTSFSELTPFAALFVVFEVFGPGFYAFLVGQSIFRPLERGVSFCRAIRCGFHSAMCVGVPGITLSWGGGVGGAWLGRFDLSVVGGLAFFLVRFVIFWGCAVCSRCYGLLVINFWLFMCGMVVDDPMASGRRSIEYFLLGVFLARRCSNSYVLLAWSLDFVATDVVCVL